MVATGLDVLQETARRRLRMLEGLPPGALLVHEIYLSLQGESTRAGLPCVFVRLTGCPLRCRYCDTAHAFAGGREMTVAEVVAEVAKLPATLIELTGGEPLSQASARPLLTGLADLGRAVLLETSGSEPLTGIDPRVTVVMDVKTPSSGEADAHDADNFARLKAGDEVKFVIGDRADFDFALAVVARHRLERFALLASPVHGSVPLAELAGWILGSGVPFRLQPQLHKLIWGPGTRGV